MELWCGGQLIFSFKEMNYMRNPSNPLYNNCLLCLLNTQLPRMLNVILALYLTYS
jgi:hypothetical protein